MSNEKKIEDYLHLYLGCDVYVDRSEVNLSSYTGKLIGITEKNEVTFYDVERSSTYQSYHNTSVKPILRPLSSQTREEQMEELSISKALGDVTGAETAAEITRHRLKKGFDLFQLIESGLAIDATKQFATNN